MIPGKLLWPAAATVVFALALQIAAAKDPEAEGEKESRLVEAFDENSDGSLDPEELKALRGELRELFAELRAEHPGFFGRRRGAARDRGYPPFRRRMGGRLERDDDENGDGKEESAEGDERRGRRGPRHGWGRRGRGPAQFGRHGRGWGRGHRASRGHMGRRAAGDGCCCCGHGMGSARGMGMRDHRGPRHGWGRWGRGPGQFGRHGQGMGRGHGRFHGRMGPRFDRDDEEKGSVDGKHKCCCGDACHRAKGSSPAEHGHHHGAQSDDAAETDDASDQSDASEEAESEAEEGAESESAADPAA